MSESDIIYGQSKTTDNIVTGPVHDGSGEEPVTEGHSESGDTASKTAATVEAASKVDSDESSPLVVKRTYLVQQSDDVNDASTTTAPADSQPVQKGMPTLLVCILCCCRFAFDLVYATICINTSTVDACLQSEPKCTISVRIVITVVLML